MLVEPAGRYQVADGKIPRFDLQTYEMMSKAIDKLNEQKIVPTITSGYQSPEYQEELRRSGSGITPARVSRHQVGQAVDFGLNSNQGNNDAIQQAMTDVGFTWGGTYKRPKPDPVHYQSPSGGQAIDPAYVRACLRAITGE